MHTEIPEIFSKYLAFHMVIYACLALFGLMALSRWLYGSRCVSSVRLDGRTVVITGGNTGIGIETVKDLAHRGARIIVGCRNTTAGEEKVAAVKLEIGSCDITVQYLDLSSLKSVRSFAERLLRTETHIHILINNAGVACCPPLKTKDGFEMQLGVNHLGHFYLTLLLLDRLKASAPARIVVVSSIAHTVGRIHFDDLHLDKQYNPFTAYFQSKLANILFARELAERLKGTGVNVYCLHPGAVHTGLGRHLGQSVNSFTCWLFFISGLLFFKTPKQGAQTTIYCAVSEEVQDQSGLYYSDCKVKEPAQQAKNAHNAKQLWELSEQLVGLQMEEAI